MQPKCSSTISLTSCETPPRGRRPWGDLTARAIRRQHRETDPAWAHNPIDAARLLAAVPGVTRAADDRARPAGDAEPEAPVDREIGTALLRRLLDDGVAVERVAPVAPSSMLPAFAKQRAPALR